MTRSQPDRQPGQGATGPADSGRPVFGSAPPGVACRPRAAAYAVIADGAGRIAVVRGPPGYWLPGGGALPGETPEATVLREVREELGRPVRLVGRLGEAVQVFYAAADGCWYEMTAVFFAAELDGEATDAGEPGAGWLDAAAAGGAFFHACHTWAVARAGEARA